MLEKSIIGLLIIIVILHLLGIAYFYEHPWISYDSPIGYDKFLHFLGGMWIALFFYQQTKMRCFICLLILVLIMGVSWEIFEWTWDQTFHKWYGLIPAQASFIDTLWDIFWDFIGGLTISFYLWKKKLLQ